MTALRKEIIMVQRICPICDHVMKGSHYCHECHRFVKHPNVVNVSYSLNEPRSGMEAAPVNRDPASPNRQREPYSGKLDLNGQPVIHQAVNRLNAAIQYRKDYMNRKGEGGGNGIGIVLAAIVVIILILAVGLAV